MNSGGMDRGEKLIGSADVTLMQERKESDTERRRKLWEKAKEIGNP